MPTKTSTISLSQTRTTRSGDGRLGRRARGLAQTGTCSAGGTTTLYATCSASNRRPVTSYQTRTRRRKVSTNEHFATAFSTARQIKTTVLVLNFAPRGPPVPRSLFSHASSKGGRARAARTLHTALRRPRQMMRSAGHLWAQRWAMLVQALASTIIEAPPQFIRQQGYM